MPETLVHPSHRFFKFDTEAGGLSDRDREAIFNLADAGLKAWSIARRLRKHPSTVSYFMYRNGLKQLAAKRRQPFRRGGVLVIPFSEEEDDFIQEKSIDGISASRIAAMMEPRFGVPRSRDAVTSRLMLLASDETAREVA